MTALPDSLRARIVASVARTASDVAAEILGPAIEAAHPGELPGLARPAIAAGDLAGVAITARLDALAGLAADGNAAADAALRAVTTDRRFAAWAAHAVARGITSGSGIVIAHRLPTHVAPSVAATLAQIIVDGGPAASVAAASLLDWLGGAGAHAARLPSVRASMAGAWAASRNGRLLVALAMAEGAAPAMSAGPDRDTPSEDTRADVALSSILERTQDGALRDRLMPLLVGWLAHPRLGRSVQRSLASITDPAARSNVLARGHRLALPVVRAGAAAIGRPGRCIPPAPHIAELPSSAAAGLVRLVAALPLSPARRSEAFADLAVHRDALVRRAALQHLSTEPLRRTAVVLGRAAAGRDALAARVARRALGPSGAVLDPRLAERGVPAIRRAARRRLAVAGREADHALAPDDRSEAVSAVDALVSRTSADAGTSPAWRRGLLLGALERDRDLALSAWAADIASHRRDVAGPAIGTARRFGLAAALAPRLVEVVGGDDERLAAAAVAALGTIRPAARDESVRLALHRALDHPGARVRASAIEAIARDDLGSAPQALARIARAAGSDDPRERANAIIAVSPHDPERGRALLGCMLRDRRPRHRVSAVWATQHLAAIGHETPAMGAALRSVADRDPSPLVRTRAGRAHPTGRRTDAESTEAASAVAGFGFAAIPWGGDVIGGAGDVASSAGTIGPTLGGWLMIAALVSVVGVIVGRRWLAWRHPRRAIDAAILREAGVGWRDRRAIGRLATAAGVPHATSLMLSRGAFDAAVRDAAMAIPPRAARRLSRLAPDGVQSGSGGLGFGLEGRPARSAQRAASTGWATTAVESARPLQPPREAARDGVIDDRDSAAGMASAPAPAVDPDLWVDAHRRARAFRGQ